MKLSETIKSKTKEDILAELKALNIDVDKCTINSDLSVSFKGNLDLSHENFEYFPIQFKEVSGYFDCSNNSKLKSLEGCPTIVGKTFDCSECPKLTSLKFAPTTLRDGCFFCTKNPGITSLEGIPNNISKHLNISGCTNLTTLEHMPKTINGVLNIYNLKKLKSFDFLPDSVNGHILFNDNGIVKNYLALFAIDGVTEFQSTNLENGKVVNSKIMSILNKYYRDDQNVAECQEELETAGFGEYTEF